MIEDEIPVNRQMLGEVYELIDIFPYFQSAHMLLLKGLQNNADVKLENQLRLSAIHIADREVLYYLLKSKPPPGGEPDDISEMETSAESAVSSTQQNVIESAKNSDDFISEIEKEEIEFTSNLMQDLDDQKSGHPIMISSEPDNDDKSGIMFMLDEDDTPIEENIFYMDPGISIPDYSDLLELDLADSPLNAPENIDLGEDTSDKDENKARIMNQSELIDQFIISIIISISI